MPDAVDIFHRLAARHIERESPLAGESELATPAQAAEAELTPRHKAPTIIECYAIFYGDPRLPETKGRLFRDEADAWAYGKVLSTRPRKVTVILEDE